MPDVPRLCIFERELAPGKREHTWLVAQPDGAAIQVEDGAPLPLPPGSVARVFERYGQVFDVASGVGGEARSASGDTRLHFTEGLLKRLRHRTWFDVEPRDYLVFQPHGEGASAEGWPRYELCTAISAALVHLAEAYRAARSELRSS
ncbi:MAG: hypothetical protein KC766_33450 [Myxococcales bacterium]|nr:hypothetical protein [Myxococcales bacterium]